MIKNCPELKTITNLQDLIKIHIHSSNIPLIQALPNFKRLRIEDCDLSSFSKLEQTNIEKLHLIKCTNVENITLPNSLKLFQMVNCQNMPTQLRNQVISYIRSVNAEIEGHQTTFHGFKIQENNLEMYLDETTYNNIQSQ
jgi:hypothetical protein